MDRPSWVQPSQQMGTGFMPTPRPQQPMLGASSPDVAGSGLPDAAGNTGMHTAGATAPGLNNPNAWDGIGPNTNRDQPAPNHVSNVGNPVDASGANLPQNIQQMLSLFQGLGGQGFQGFQPVNGNPFANLGSNINQWGKTSAPGGIYGGT